MVTAEVCQRSTPFIVSQPIYLIGDHALNVSWLANDNVEIREFHVGIVPEENYTDTSSDVTYFQSAGQSHFTIFDPDLISTGKLFYLSLKVTDVALHEVRVDIGPIIVDISPPVVNGSLDVQQDGNHMIVEWQEGTFHDEESRDPLQFEFAIGRSQFSEDIQSFNTVPAPDSTHCPTPYCFAVNLATLGTSLITGHTYFITMRAINSAGLMSYSTNNLPFMYTHGLPSVGVVFDIDPTLSPELTDGINYSNLDVDIILDPTELASRWEGFTHPHLDVTLSVSLGTQPYSDDVISMTTIGGNTSYIVNGTYLDHSVTYYFTMVAENSVGRVSASSDGVLVLRNLEAWLQHSTVFDGHFDIDVDYQASISSADAHWIFPANIHSFVSHYMLALVRVVNPSDFELVTGFQNVGLQVSHSMSGLQLQTGAYYASAVKACLAGTCLSPVYSDGFEISIPPSVGSLSAVYSPENLDMEFGISRFGYLEISWDSFSDPQMAYYEWALGTGELGSELLVHWTQTEWFETSVHVNITASVSLHTSNIVTIRGYNNAGLYSSLTTQVKWRVNEEVLPQSSVPRSPLVVVDVQESDVEPLTTSDWRQRQFREWDPVDLQYTRSPDSLSGAWPNLRYMRYEYSITTTPAYGSCESPNTIACGETIANSVTVRGLSLTHGQRYYFCVRAVRGDAIHITSATPSLFMSCSNGITVDLTPPTGGCVHIITPLLNGQDISLGSGSGSGGIRPLLDVSRECIHGNESTFQSSTSELFIRWEQFTDVEMDDSIVHAHGVAYYEYAIGEL